VTETSDHIDNLLIHIGPHKTGTSSIQALLKDNVELLHRWGYHYPPSPLRNGTHQHIAYHLHGLDVRQLPHVPGDRADFSASDVATEMATWLRRAHELSCHTVLISAEDFYAWSLENWVTFAQLLSEAEATTGITFSRVTICLTDRDIAERASSQYSQYLKAGLARSAADINELLRQRIADRDAVVLQIPSAFLAPVTIQHIPYSTPASTSTFLQSWVGTVLGPEVLRSLPKHSFRTTLNQRTSRVAQSRFLKFNQINSPESQDLFTPFRALAPDDDERSRALQRLNLMRSALEDLAHAESKVNRLEATLLWRLAKRLGIVKVLLKKRSGSP
jgi:hypothetical protein